MIGDRWLREKDGKDDSFAAAIQANAISIVGEKPGYQNGAKGWIRAHGSNPARHTKREVRTFRRAEVLALPIWAIARLSFHMH